MVKSDKLLRLCSVEHRSVVCDGLCKVVDDAGVSKVCLVFEKSLDLALNCRR